MSTSLESLLQVALSLPEADRAELVDTLIESLDPEEEANVEAAWAAEVERRSRELDAGTAKTMPWSEVKVLVRNQAKAHA